MLTVDLNGRWWVQGGPLKKKIGATVPGSIFEDLLQSGQIPDPYFRDQELSLRWVGEQDWHYTRKFRVSRGFLEQDLIELVCDGLDTLATITINGHLVAKTDNMYRTWRFDVKPYLLAGSNQISIKFSSATRYAEAKHHAHPLPEWKGLMDQHGGNWMRKEPCNFGWDWGPNLVGCGIWRGIRLEGYDHARLADVLVNQQHQRSRVKLSVRLDIEHFSDQPLKVVANLKRLGQMVVGTVLPDVREHCEFDLDVPDPELWWPNGLGPQALYDLEVDLFDQQDELLDRWHRTIGLRTLRLETKPDRAGESFQFVVNGKPFFAKGANWIPPEANLGRLHDSLYQQLVADAASANMNMLRVWGGGLYESDVFYQACDQLGICVWQDFVFACAAYPLFDEDFRTSVLMEIADNLRRLRHHPCLALWCGNNELEMGLIGEGWTDRHMDIQDYQAFFDVALKELVAELSPQVDYWPSSPHSPHGNRLDHSAPNCGDAHLWDVWHGKKPFEWYRTCQHRFCSEFGFQSFPAAPTVRRYTQPSDRNITSYVMEHHQRHPAGNSLIMHYMLDWFQLPVGFENTLYLSQVLQSQAIKYAVEHWRRNKPRTMGTLYWQLNDCWPVASWASIDCYGCWKALHYVARRFYAPVLVSAVEDGEKKTVTVFGSNDLNHAIEAELIWHVTTADGTLLGQGTQPVKLKPQQSKRLSVLRLMPWVQQYGVHNILVWLELRRSQELCSSNLVMFARPKHLELKHPGIAVKVTQKKNAGQPGKFVVELTSRHTAMWVCCELGCEERWSDNFFHLNPGQKHRIDLFSPQYRTPEEVKTNLVVRDLYRSCCETGDTHKTK